MNNNKIWGYSTIILCGLFALILSWWMEKDYINSSDQIVSINYKDKEKLYQHIDRYVRITNACFPDSVITFEDNSSKKEISPFIGCTMEYQDSTHLFSVLENKFFPTLFFKQRAIENGDIFLNEGKLTKYAFFNSSAESLINNELHLSFNPHKSFILLAGKSPNSSRLLLTITFIVILIVVVGCCFFLYFYFKKVEQKKLDQSKIS